MFFHQQYPMRSSDHRANRGQAYLLVKKMQRKRLRIYTLIKRRGHSLKCQKSVSTSISLIYRNPCRQSMIQQRRHLTSKHRLHYINVGFGYYFITLITLPSAVLMMLMPLPRDWRSLPSTENIRQLCKLSIVILPMPVEGSTIMSAERFSAL